MGTKLLLTSWPIFWWPRNCGLYLLSCPCFLLLLISCLEEFWVLVMRGKKTIFCSCFHDFYLLAVIALFLFITTFVQQRFQLSSNLKSPARLSFFQTETWLPRACFNLWHIWILMWLIILKKKKIKSDLKLNHTQGQLKCFFKLYHVVQDDAEKQCNQITVSLA